MKFLLFVVLLSVCIAFTTSAITPGVYTDSRKGGSFNICATNNTANGLYSEFGLALGTVNTSNSRTTWAGEWYEGGLGDCLYGTFSLTFSSSSFSGSYTCNNNDTLEYEWSGDLQEKRSNLTARECGTVGSGSLLGKWSFEDSQGLYQVDFCVDGAVGSDEDDFDSEWEASYFRPNNFIPIGYDNGVTPKSEIAVGSFYRSNEDGALPGTALWFVSADGDLSYIWWAGHYDYLNIDLIADTEIHGYETYTLKSGTTADQCSRFEPIADEPYDYYPYEYELFYFRETSSASALVGSVLLSLFVFFL